MFQIIFNSSPLPFVSSNFQLHKVFSLVWLLNLGLVCIMYNIYMTYIINMCYFTIKIRNLENFGSFPSAQREEWGYGERMSQYRYSHCGKFWHNFQ